MKLFKKKKTQSIPSECEGLEIKTESSVCTGEKTIGFYNPETKKLMYAELVLSEKDIDNFYKKYNMEKQK